MKTVKDRLEVLTVRKIILNDLESEGVWSIMWKDYNKIKVIARSVRI
jgi:acetyl-CoA carboxylase alpha subunit